MIRVLRLLNRCWDQLVLSRGDRRAGGGWHNDLLLAASDSLSGGWKDCAGDQWCGESIDLAEFIGVQLWV